MRLRLCILIGLCTAAGCAPPKPGSVPEVDPLPLSPAPLAPGADDEDEPDDDDDAPDDDEAPDGPLQEHEPKSDGTQADQVDTADRADQADQDESGLDQEAPSGSKAVDGNLDSRELQSDGDQRSPSAPRKRKAKPRSRSVATPPPTCDTPECQKACGEYSDTKKDECVKAFANGCFEPKPPKDYECGDFTGIKAKALPMGDL